MKYSCNMIRDLLPLYADGVCSDESRSAVAEHLMVCPDCTGLLRQLQSTEIETALQTEKASVLKRQAQRLRRRSALAGTIVACIFMVPILICLIVNLATGAPLGWFFVVLAAMLLAASVVIVPLVVRKNRFFWSSCSTLVFLLLLLGVCCLYTHGSWFLTAACAVLFAASIGIFPFVARKEPLRSLLGRNAALVSALAGTVFFILMLLCIGMYTAAPFFWPVAAAVVVPLLILAWILFLIFRYLPTRKAVKAGVCCIVCGVFAFFAERLVYRLMGGHISGPVFAPLTWNAATIDGNVMWLVLLGACLAGIILVVIGIVKERRNQK